MMCESSLALAILIIAAIVYPDPHILCQKTGVLPQDNSKFQYLTPVRANQPLVVKGTGRECEFFCYLLKPNGTRLGTYNIVAQSEQGCDITYTPTSGSDLFLQMRNPTDSVIHYQVMVTQQ